MSVRTGQISPEDRHIPRSVPGDLRGRFLWLARTYSAHLFDYAEDLLGDRGASAEAVEGSLTEAIHHFDRAELEDAGADGSLRPWLYAVVRRECMITLSERDEETALDSDGVADQEAGQDPERYVTGSSRTQEAVADVLTAEYMVSDLEAEEHRRYREAVTQVLGGLSDDEVEVLSLAIRHELDEDDLAIVLGVSSRRAHAELSGATAKFAQLAATILLLHAGWSGCKKLDRLVGGAYPSSPDDGMRRRVAKHSKSCAICGQIVASRGFGPELLSILPVTELPPAVRRWLGSVAPSRDADPPHEDPPDEDPRDEGPPGQDLRDEGAPDEELPDQDPAEAGLAPAEAGLADLADADPQISSDLPYTGRPGSPYADESGSSYAESSYGHPIRSPYIDSPYAGPAGPPYAGSTRPPYAGRAESPYAGSTRPPYEDSPYAGSTGSPYAGPGGSSYAGSPYAGPEIPPLSSRQVPAVPPLPGPETVGVATWAAAKSVIPIASAGTSVADAPGPAADLTAADLAPAGSSAADLAAGSGSESPGATGSSDPALADADSMPGRETWLTRPRAAVLSALAIVVIAVGAVLASKLAAAPAPRHHRSVSVTSTHGPSSAPSGTAPSSSAQPSARAKPSKSGSAPPAPAANFPVSSPPPFKPTSEPSVLRPTPKPSSTKPKPSPTPTKTTAPPTSAPPTTSPPPPPSSSPPISPGT